MSFFFGGEGFIDFCLEGPYCEGPGTRPKGEACPFLQLRVCLSRSGTCLVRGRVAKSYLPFACSPLEKMVNMSSSDRFPLTPRREIYIYIYV